MSCGLRKVVPRSPSSRRRNGEDNTVEPAHLIESLTGCPPANVAASCGTDDLRAARLLIDEALDLQISGPRLHLVEEPAAQTG